MAEQAYSYVIVGGGLAGASAAAGIREIDQKSEVLLIGDETHLPYDRPPLTKQLWSGKKKVEEIFVHDQKFYEQNRVRLVLGTELTGLDLRQMKITDDRGQSYRFEKLLLATGGAPRPLPVPGSTWEGIYYYRYLDDYLRMRGEAAAGKSAVVIGGGFIGSEMAAALHTNKVDVTMIFPSAYLCSRVFPDYLGREIQKRYQERGIKVLAGERPAAFTKHEGRFSTRTESGKEIKSDLVIVGTGITPETKLAEGAGLKTENGIVVDEYLQTSHSGIYAAGDNAFFPYQALQQKMRVEHWDNALNQGKWAGRNMAGARQAFRYMPYFFSDLFEFGYEAVGEVDSRLETFADWKEENKKGVIYYLRDGKVRGVMMCNVWEKVPEARELIKRARRVSPQSLRGAIQ